MVILNDNIPRRKKPSRFRSLKEYDIDILGQSWQPPRTRLLAATIDLNNLKMAEMDTAYSISHVLMSKNIMRPPIGPPIFKCPTFFQEHEMAAKM